MTAPLLELVQAFIANEGWTATPIEGLPALRMQFRSQHGPLTTFLRVRESHGQIVFYTQCPLPVPADRRAAVTEFVTRANYGMIVGNFELDLVDGDLRFKTCLDLGPAPSLAGLPPFARLFGPMIGTALGAMDRYLPGITEVVAGRAPAEALAAVETPVAAPTPAP